MLPQNTLTTLNLAAAIEVHVSELKEMTMFDLQIQKAVLRLWPQEPIAGCYREK